MSDEQEPKQPTYVHIYVDDKEVASFLASGSKTDKQQSPDEATIRYWNDIANYIGGTAIVGESGEPELPLPEGATVIFQEDKPEDGEA